MLRRRFSGQFLRRARSARRSPATPSPSSPAVKDRRAMEFMTLGEGSWRGSGSFAKPATSALSFEVKGSSATTMAPDPRGLAIVIMGVSGAGKSTVAQMLARSLGCRFLEADDFHSQANKEKMGNSIPLSDEDRIPWLEALRDTIEKYMASGETVTLTCSALQQNYRDILRSADSEYQPGDYPNCKVKFVCLEAPMQVLADRINRRSKEGSHFMPATLLQSQYDLLQIDEAEGIARVDATESLQTIIGSIEALFNTQLNCI